MIRFLRNAGKILKETEHKPHGTNFEKTEEKKCVNAMKKKCMTTGEKTGKILAAGVATLSSPVAAKLPCVENLSRTLRNVRQKHNPMPADPKRGDVFEIPAEFTVTAKGDQFLMYDKSGKDRLLIFCTKKNLQTLKESYTWYGDGTFSCVSRSSSQLYTLHGEVNSKVVPLVYILTTNATKRTYVRILMKLLEFEPMLEPKRMMCDFEQAFISAIKDVFPQCSIAGCLFHLGQSLWRNIVTCKLQKLYKASYDARDFRKLYALAFVPIEDVCYAYDVLLRTNFYVKNEALLQEYLNYFERTWLGVLGRRNERSEPRFSIELWNQYLAVKNDLARTNNSVEG